MTGDAEPERRCPWCSAVAEATATSCSACGAALAQRESIGDLVIPGVTGLDPALQGLEDRPMRIPGSSPTQGLASGVAVAAAMGGPVAIAALGGLGAVAAAEYLGARRTHGSAPEDLADVGRVSEVARQALERLEHEADAATGIPAADADPGRDEPVPAPAHVDQDPWRDVPSAPAAEHDPWRDMPAESTGSAEPPPDPWRDEPARLAPPSDVDPPPS